MKTKVIALYLPQFHETPENNEWWGEGYTDWKAVKECKPNFKGHNQPRIPLNDNYYSLDSVETMRWQADLAKEYGIDGFCIYHYYSVGKLQMQKPAEIILNDKDIDMKFFFSWANHDFLKQWFNGDGRLLRRQEYGTEKEWENHYKYLSQFFNDSRYIKIDGKPVFVIYDVFHIHCFNEMMLMWDRLAKQDGFKGIYIIATKSNTNLKSLDLLEKKWINKVFVFEPMNYRSNGKNGNYVYITYRRIKTVLIRLNNKYFSKKSLQEKFSINKAYRAICSRRMMKDELYGFFTDWDNTPRYREKSIVFWGASVELFEYYFNIVYKKSCNEKKEFLFINAWNEWGESAYLEPDKLNKYRYLEAIKRSVRNEQIY